MHWSKAPLQRFDTSVEEGPFQYILMDLITDLPKSQGFDSILMILDQGCSKAAKFIPCMKTIDGTGVALEYLKHLVPWFGLPKWIISDCDPWFTLRLQKTCARYWEYNKTYPPPSTLALMDRQNTWMHRLNSTCNLGLLESLQCGANSFQ